jgi:transcriptional regulator with XRE-family HTH domain
MNSFAEKLNSLRRERGLTVPQVARAAGVCRQAVYFWEQGRTKNLRHESMQRVAKLFNMTTDELIGKTDVSQLEKSLDGDLAFLFAVMDQQTKKMWLEIGQVLIENRSNP